MKTEDDNCTCADCFKEYPCVVMKKVEETTIRNVCPICLERCKILTQGTDVL